VDNRRIIDFLIPAAERSNARVCGGSVAGVAGSNPARGMNVCVVCVLYSKDKRQSQDSQDKELQMKCREKKSRWRHGCLCCNY
jgi:hypothetical protein